MSTKKDWTRKIDLRIAKIERASFAPNKFLKSKVFFKKIKTRLNGNNKTAYIWIRGMDYL